MEYNKTEIAVIAEASKEHDDQPIQQLTELQLALIGGGAAEVSFG